MIVWRAIRWTEAGDRPLPNGKFICHRSAIGGVVDGSGVACVALRAKTEQLLAKLRLQNHHFKNQQSSLDNHQSVAGENSGTAPRSFAESVPNSPQRREVQQGQERGRKLLVLSNLFKKIKAQVRTHALGPLTDRSTYRFSEGATSIWFCNPITSESLGS